MNITILGAGYVGLVQAVSLADFGFKVTCIEKDTEKLSRALCLKDLTSIKDLYARFKKNDLTQNLDIVNIAKLYKHC